MISFLIVASLLGLVSSDAPGELKPVPAPDGSTTLGASRFILPNYGSCAPERKFLTKCRPSSIAKRCPTSRCFAEATEGYYCGLKFTFYKTHKYIATGCRQEGDVCSRCCSWPTCKCYTTYGWKKENAIINRYGSYYVIKFYIRLPNGCSCNEEQKATDWKRGS